LWARDVQGAADGAWLRFHRHATQGRQAIDMANELRPDLVLMDIQLAGDMDGIMPPPR
jgi:CheY-like chemotaxis protein